MDEKIEAIGEFGLIERITALLAVEAPAGSAVSMGIGDDAAIWTPRAGAAVVVTTDALIEGIHFRLDLMSWADVGHRALAANLSDLASMAARPGVAVVTLGLRPGLLIDEVLDLYRGLARLAARHDCSIVGGDIVAAPTAIALSVTALGEQEVDAHGAGISFRRDAAQPGDLLAVTGPLGLSAAGLRLLLADPVAADADPAVAPLLAAYRRPEPRLAAAAALLAAGVRAGMDLSDGLAGDLPKLCARSGVSAVVDQAALPAPDLVRARFPAAWLDLALRGGEDFELLVALPPTRLAVAQQALVAASCPPLIVIGTVEPPGPTPLWLRTPDGRRVPLAPGAFDHFHAG
ncbi:MAG: thiamine-phosphate kinase [Chloroflexi bacterium]|nr:thiamine-phosphate kinase [Chloroflexota bacterium]